MTTTDGRSRLRKGGREILIPTQALILRFRIELQHTDPLVWRAIEVPGDYTFWDLHIAIQDAMGWQDYHLHRFTMAHPRTKKEQIFGIHNLQQDCNDPPGWATQIAAMFTRSNPVARYQYDFGDDWQHTVTLVDVLQRDFTLTYPRCVDGKGACPPEDCGGVHAFGEIAAGTWTRTRAAGCHAATTRPTSIPQRCASTTRRAAWPSRGMATRMPATRHMGEAQQRSTCVAWPAVHSLAAASLYICSSTAYNAPSARP